MKRLRLATLALVALAGIVLAGSLVTGSDVATAASSSKKTSSSSKKKNTRAVRADGTATVTIIGEVTKQTSCENRLIVNINFVKKKGRVEAISAPVDRNGFWAVAVTRVPNGTFNVTSAAIAHPRQGILEYDEYSIEVRRGKSTELDLGRLKIGSC
ncbi:MAG: hypothetical protein U0821_06470 [Chloroflexota bacterium]